MAKIKEVYMPEEENEDAMGSRMAKGSKGFDLTGARDDEEVK